MNGRANAHAKVNKQKNIRKFITHEFRCMYGHRNQPQQFLARINNTRNNEIMFYLYKGTKRTSIEWIYTPL